MTCKELFEKTSNKINNVLEMPRNNQYGSVATIPKYSLSASGYLKVDLVGNNMCGGPAQEDGETYYRLIVDVRSLDSRGFIFDSTLVDQFEQMWNTFEWNASCEQLAAGIINKVHEWCGGRAVRIEAAVTNAVGEISIEWVAGNVLPQGPVKATKAEKTKALAKREEPAYVPAKC